MSWKRSSDHKSRMKKLSKVSSYPSGAYYKCVMKEIIEVIVEKADEILILS